MGTPGLPYLRPWKPRVSQNFRVSQSRCLSGDVPLAVSIFCKAKKVSAYRFVCLIYKLCLNVLESERVELALKTL